MALFWINKALLLCAVILSASCVDGAVRGSVRGVGTTYARPSTTVYNGASNVGNFNTRPNTVYRPVSTVQTGYYPQTQIGYFPQTITNQVATLTSAQCDAKWTTALLAEMTNYDDWKCSSRVMPDGLNQACVLTGPYRATTTTTSIYVNSGCGWIIPYFCDDSIRDLVKSMVGTQQAPAPVARQDYTVIPGSGSYKMHPELLTWSQAQAVCESEGAHLITPVTGNDYTNLWAYINSLNLSLPDGVWFGFTDQAVEGEFRTVYNQPSCMFGQLPFRATQPDGGTLENCLQYGLLQDPTLNDFPCSSTLPFVCEQTLSTRLAACRTVVVSG